MSDYFIFGTGQFAELLGHALIDEEKIKQKNIFYISIKKLIKKIIFMKKFFSINNKNLSIYLGIGNIQIREKILKKLSKKKYKFPNFISKSSKIMSKCRLGKGNIILPSSTICLNKIKILI